MYKRDITKFVLYSNVLKVLLLFVVILFPGREDAGHHAPDAASPDPLDGVHTAQRDVR